MKIMKKLTLASTIAAISLPSFALEALDDEFLSDVSGQEGITIEQNSFNTIEEFLYVDGDGDGSGATGRIKATDIRIGEFSGDVTLRLMAGQTPFEANPGSAAITTSYSKTSIDAAANGVLITTEEIGDVGTGPLINNSSFTFNPGLPLTNATGQIQWNASQNRFATVADEAAGTDVIVDFQNPANGDTLDLVMKGNGRDTHIGGIEIGNANGQLNSIGSMTLLNTGNWAPSGLILSILGLAGPMGGNQVDLIFNNSNQYRETQTLISSKTSGTGVHIVTEGGIEGEAFYYEDTDGGAGGNQIGVIGIATFRLADTDDINSVDRELDSGTYFRGARSEFDLDVEDGKLVLSNQVQDSSTYLGKIFIGNVNDALLTNTGVIGGMAILGNHFEGTTSIYAH